MAFVTSEPGYDVSPADVMRYSIATELAVDDAIKVAVSWRDRDGDSHRGPVGHGRAPVRFTRM